MFYAQNYPQFLWIVLALHLLLQIHQGFGVILRGKDVKVYRASAGTFPQCRQGLYNKC